MLTKTYIVITEAVGTKPGIFYTGNYRTLLLLDAW